MSRTSLWRGLPLAAILGAMLAACSGIAPPPQETDIYLLDVRPAVGKAPSRSTAVLAVGMPRAWPGFETSRMAYVRQPHELQYFARSRWADTPARMLSPLLVQALEQGGAFGAVVHNPGPVTGTLRLDTELVRMQQEFGAEPGRVRLTLRAQLVDVRERRVIATREFEEVEVADAGNAYAGVSALNRALGRLLHSLAEFCAGASAGR